MKDTTGSLEVGILAKGRKEYTKYLETGAKLTPQGAIRANCYQCMGGYEDGKVDCGITHCPLHPYMPYRKMEQTHPKKERTEKQREADGKLALRSRGAR